MAEKVGEIYYDLTLDTTNFIDGRRVVDRETQTIVQRLNQITAAIKLYAAAAAILKSAELADNLRLLSARVEVAAGQRRRRHRCDESPGRHQQAHQHRGRR